MELHPNVLILLTIPGSTTSKQVKAYARTISSNVNELDISRVRLTTTLWKEILNMLDKHPSDIINMNHPIYRQKMKDINPTMHGYLNILLNTPEVLKGPIAVWNKKAVLCKKPTDILKLPLDKKIKLNVDHEV